MLTDKTIRAAMKAVETEIILSDGAAGRGSGALRLVIRKNVRGVSAQWFAAWKRDGQRRKLALGRYPDLTLQAAREKFAEGIRPAISAGRNPHAAVPKADRPTLERLFEGYVKNLRDRGKRSVAEVERTLLKGARNAADELGRHRLASDIGPEDIAAFLASVANRGAITQADRSRAYLSAAFNWGVKAAHNYRATTRQDWGLRMNPVAAVPKDASAVRPRDRALSADEIRALWFGLDGKGFAPETRLCVRLMICCGQRLRETLRARREDFDLEAGTWTLPASTTKNGKPHVIALPAMAIELIRAEGRPAGLLFPARARGGEIADTSVSRALRRWIDSVGAKPFQARDIRRSWKTRAGEAGVDRFIRDVIQQHARTSDVGSRHYDKTDYLPQMRAAMLRWNSWLDRVIHSAPSGLVRPLRA